MMYREDVLSLYPRQSFTALMESDKCMDMDMVPSSQETLTLLNQEHIPTAPSYIKRIPISEVNFDDSFDEEVDEIISDDDMEDDEDIQRMRMEADDTRELLSFTEMVNADIKKYFSRNKGDEDACDVYEEKWNSGKSGRELYYADLLRIAQGGEEGDEKPKRNSKKNQDKSKSSGNQADEKSTRSYSGKMNSSLGLGPLNDLFSVSFERNLSGQGSTAYLDRQTEELVARSSADPLPMSKRTFPVSFWSEPKTKAVEKPAVGNTSQGSSMMGPTRSPDFTDLLNSWTGVYEGAELPPSELLPVSNPAEQAVHTGS